MGPGGGAQRAAPEGLGVRGTATARQAFHDCADLHLGALGVYNVLMMLKAFGGRRAPSGVPPACPLRLRGWGAGCAPDMGNRRLQYVTVRYSTLQYVTVRYSTFWDRRLRGVCGCEGRERVRVMVTGERLRSSGL